MGERSGFPSHAVSFPMGEGRLPPGLKPDFSGFDVDQVSALLSSPAHAALVASHANERRPYVDVRTTHLTLAHRLWLHYLPVLSLSAAVGGSGAENPGWRGASLRHDLGPPGRSVARCLGCGATSGSCCTSAPCSGGSAMPGSSKPRTPSLYRQPWEWLRCCW
jgi:hypothetical protein